LSACYACSCGRSYALEHLPAVCVEAGHSSDLRPAEYSVPPIVRGRHPTDLDAQDCRGCGALMYWLDRRGVGRGRIPLAASTMRRIPCAACLGDGTRCEHCRGWGFLIGMVNHFADCPDRQRFKRERKKPT